MIFQEKYFSYSFNWPNFIVWLPLLLEILINICIAIVWEPDCDVTNFEINFVFLIKSFFFMTKKSRQKLIYLENEKSFWVEIKSIFHHFKGLSISKSCLRHESAPLRQFDLIKIFKHQYISNKGTSFFFWYYSNVLYSHLNIFFICRLHFCQHIRK